MSNIIAYFPPTDWQQELATAFTEPAALLKHLKLSPQQIPCLTGSLDFPVKVPRSFVKRMQAGNPEDPLLLQALPLLAESLIKPGFSTDPVGDISSVKTSGLLQKYQGRVLLITTGACAINCRYCFRRNFPYPEIQLTRSQHQQALDYIRSNPDITEVILSGGDPLLLNDAKISDLMKKIDDIDHVLRVRIHTRLPVVLPSRVTRELIIALKKFSRTIIVVIHSNHANELDLHVDSACRTLASHGILLLNQSVLLRAINDSVHALSQLSTRLVEIGVMPYYLHLLDKAQGTHHFDIDEQQAAVLMKQLKTRLPGYMVPRLVKEQAGQVSKTLIM